MAVAIAKAHHLVLNGRAIAWADRINVAAIKRRFAKVVADGSMRLRIGPGHGTGNRRPTVSLAKATEPWVVRITALPFQHRPIDAAAIKPRRRTGFQPTYWQAQGPQRLAQIAGLCADPATRFAG